MNTAMREVAKGELGICTRLKRDFKRYWTFLTLSVNDKLLLTENPTKAIWR